MSLCGGQPQPRALTGGAGDQEFDVVYETKTRNS
jgi:hypothetical protein